MKKFAKVVKKADFMQKFIDKVEELATGLGYETNIDYNWGIETKYTMVISKEFKTYLVVETVVTTKEYDTITVYDANGMQLKQWQRYAADFDYKMFVPILDYISDILVKDAPIKQEKETVEETKEEIVEERPKLYTAEQVYDYGESTDWKDITNKEYAILAKDIELARLAIADMEDKGIIVPGILFKLKRKSNMGKSFKDLVVQAAQAQKQGLSKTAGGYKDKVAELLNDIQKPEPIMDYISESTAKEICQEIGIPHEADWYKGDIFGYLAENPDGMVDVLMEYITESDAEALWSRIERDASTNKNMKKKAGVSAKTIKKYKQEGYVEEGTPEYEEFYNEGYTLKKRFFSDPNSKEYVVVEMERMAEKTAEDDVKLKVQKNKPAGLDTSSPKQLPEGARQVAGDVYKKYTSIQSIKAELEALKKELDATYAAKVEESGLAQEMAELQRLTQATATMLTGAENITFELNQNLVTFVNEVKTVAPKPTDKWKFEKVFAKLEELMGKDNAQKFLQATENGLKSQSVEKAVKELVFFEPTKKQQKTSDTHDDKGAIDKLISALKDIYTNLRNYYIETAKANQIVEQQLLPATTAKKNSGMSKKAEWTDENFAGLWEFAFSNRLVFKSILKGLSLEEQAAFSRWIQKNKTEDEIRAFNEKYSLEELLSSKKKNFSKKAKMNKKAGESYGWVVEPDDAWEKLWLFAEAFGEKETLDALARAMGDDELSDNLAYIFRMYDFREGCSDYDDDEEDGTDTESKKKPTLKKAKVSKKASVQLNMEIEDYIELLKNEYETSPEDWKTRGGKLLINELYDYMESYDGSKVEMPSIVIDNFLVNGSFCERSTDFTADGEWSNKFEEYKGNWDDFCENEAVIYNENAACTNLGF